MLLSSALLNSCSISIKVLCLFFKHWWKIAHCHSYSSVFSLFDTSVKLAFLKDRILINTETFSVIFSSTCLFQQSQNCNVSEFAASLILKFNYFTLNCFPVFNQEHIVPWLPASYFLSRGRAFVHDQLGSVNITLNHEYYCNFSQKCHMAPYNQGYVNQSDLL